MASSLGKPQLLAYAIKGLVSDRTPIIPPKDSRSPPSTDQCEHDAIHNEQSSAGVGVPPNTPSSAVSETVTTGLPTELMEAARQASLQIGPIGAKHDEISSRSHLPQPVLSERRNQLPERLQQLFLQLFTEISRSFRPTLTINTTSDHQTWDVTTEIDSSPQEQFSREGFADGMNKSQSTLNGNECGPTGPKGENMGQMKSESIINIDSTKEDSNQDETGKADGVTGCRLKKVIEVWDKQASQYMIVESLKMETNDGLGGYTFIVRDHVDKNTKETTTYIDVKSELLRDVLQEVLSSVRSVSVMEEELSIEQNTLFHFISELEEYLVKLQGNAHNRPRVESLTLLVDYLREAYGSTIERLAALVNAGQITYDTLWALFKPGCIVYTTCQGSGKPRGVIFDAGEERKSDDQLYYQLECRFIDYDGKRFGEAGIVLGIKKFRGAQPIHSLTAFPLQYHPDRDRVRRDLMFCGRKFCDLTSKRLQHCHGSAFIMNDDQVIKLNIDSHVYVDANIFHEMNPNYSRLRLFNSKNYSSADEIFKEQRQRDQEKLKESGLGLESMTDDDYTVCSPTVQCFSFAVKMFLQCAVSDIIDISWNPELFDSDKLDDDTKELLCSSMTACLQAHDGVGLEYFIEGKRSGLNVLLYGAPGTGKTFTVEALIERFKLPLYSISVSELIVNNEDLDRIFKIAKHCRAVLLLDEADVFMERRTSYHDSHNRLVFLRQLEDYDGILFMTTNRVVEFDDAILSRIHLKVKYEQLSLEHSWDIWTYFLSKATTKAGECIVDESQMKYLASKKLNGREILNIVKIAHALATVKETPVSYQHLELAAKSNDKFMKEFNNSDHLENMYT